MTAEFHQQFAGGLCSSESLKAFNQMYNSHNAYGGGFFKDDKQYPMFPFLAQHFAPYAAPATSSFSPSASSSSSNSSTAQTNTKKKPVPVPAEQKDESYYERRRRNNEAAKKSREQRRKQDNDNEVRVRFLTEENMNLKIQLQQCTMEYERLKQQFVAYQLTMAPDATNPAAVAPHF